MQASDYAGVVEGMIAENVDLAFFGPFAYVVAGINGAKLTPLGAVVGEKGEEPGYQSYGIAKADNATDQRTGGLRGQEGVLRRPGLDVRLPLPDRRAHRGGRDQVGFRGRHLRGR